MVPEPDDIAGSIPDRRGHQILFRAPALPCERVQELQFRTGIDIVKIISPLTGVLQHNVILQLHDIVYLQNLGYLHEFRLNLLRLTEVLPGGSPVTAGDSRQQAKRQKHTHGTAPANPYKTGTISRPHIRKQFSHHKSILSNINSNSGKNPSLDSSDAVRTSATEYQGHSTRHP